MSIKNDDYKKMHKLIKRLESQQRTINILLFFIVLMNLVLFIHNFFEIQVDFGNFIVVKITLSIFSKCISFKIKMLVPTFSEIIFYIEDIIIDVVLIFNKKLTMLVEGIILPFIGGAIIPFIDGVIIPFIDGVIIPFIDGVIIPLYNKL